MPHVQNIVLHRKAGRTLEMYTNCIDEERSYLTFPMYLPSLAQPLKMHMDS